MDGASKFVRGDAIAGIVITVINVIGGFAIGLQGGMSLAEAAEVFTKLTIGDGLVSQVPAFLISLAAGLLVTRSTKRTNLPTEFLSQLFARPQALLVSGGFLFILVFTNLPTLPLLSLAGGCVGLAIVLNRQNKQRKAEAFEAEQKSQDENKPKKEERIEDYLTIDPMELELGVGLIAWRIQSWW